MAEERIIIAGFGGQGIMFMGKLLCYAGMMEDRHVTYMPSYGAEVRGGTAYCNVIISSEEIPSPVVSDPTAAIIMNMPSLAKFEAAVVKKGLMVVNSSLVTRAAKRKDIELIPVPATSIADRLGNTRVANMVALGGFLAKRAVVDIATVTAAIQEILPASRSHLIEVNRQAIAEGKIYVEAHSSAAIWSKLTRGFGFA
ncbi:MAG: 2-oxoacid:acceptor oxidoreductase family protein [Candidatus Aureabacteria bacterium]|nr:2-oxoacid:acceptor oxidoreductase family protein [Candidatus Auribacterota bacterium]